jgi:hypothetical protein
MSISISMCHGIRPLEAVVVSDRRVSTGSSVSDSEQKLCIFESRNYYGVLVGVGVANYLKGIMRELPEIKADHLDDFTAKIHSAYMNLRRVQARQWTDDKMEDILMRSGLFSPENQKKIITARSGFISEKEQEDFIRITTQEADLKYQEVMKSEIQKALEVYDQINSRSKMNLTITAFDRKKGIIRQFYQTELGSEERFSDIMSEGSGSPGAEHYFAHAFQGITKSMHLKTSDLIFYALNGYNNARINNGVGGDPEIVVVSGLGVNEILDRTSIALSNLSCGYLSNFADSVLTHTVTRELVNRILDSDNTVYQELAKILETDIATLTTVSIPYSEFQVRANKKHFNNTHAQLRLL